jgi:membrane carboxypeptidase/penicillin-binding protein PbpC
MVGSQQSLAPYQQPMVDLLRQVVERGTGKAAALNGFAAGKTGTSQNHRDAWFIGFNESLVVGVWVGNDDGTSMNRVVGGTLPASIWKRFMTQAAALTPRTDARAITVDRAAQAPSQPQASQPQESQPQASQPEAAQPQASQRSQASQATSEPQPAQCDYRACASRRSFRPSDCTYQPYDGPRRLCESRRQTASSAQISQPASPGEAPQAPTTQGRAQCNVDVCSRFYSSFNSSDCTYQPYGGGSRRVCDR